MYESLHDSDLQMYPLFFSCSPQVFNEANSPFNEANTARAAKALAALNEEDRAESAKKYSINGYLFCNLPGLNMTVGDKCVTWCIVWWLWLGVDACRQLCFSCVPVAVGHQPG